MQLLLCSFFFQFCNLFWIGRIGHFFLMGCLPHQRLVTDICPFAFLWCRLCQKFANITMGNCPKARVAKGLKVHVSSIALPYVFMCQKSSFLTMLGGPKSPWLKPLEIPLPNWMRRGKKKQRGALMLNNCKNSITLLRWENFASKLILTLPKKIK